ncbi:MAG TPA: PH domain-containing protein [Bryobacteraceae bacterium]|nr:PH domain-containing protein [Bryobacteraceae bacterium]
MNGWLLRLLRVPPEPTPPDGSPDSILVFRAGRNYFRWRIVVWAVSQVALIAFAFVPLVVLSQAHKLPPLVFDLLAGFEALYLASLLAIIPLTFWMQKLNYELRWYIVTDRSLRIRSGIWAVQELTMTFANIQDLRITEGPLQSLLGLADLEVRSAGGGGAPGPYGASVHSHGARFAGVDNAGQIRDLIVERLRRYRDAGLGDGHDPHPVSASPSLESATAELLREARALRAAVEAN